jgi:hypothetical protein
VLPNSNEDRALVDRSLGKRLELLLAGGFFRPLSRPTAAVYVDCAERLIETADEGGQVLHGEARLLIRGCSCDIQMSSSLKMRAEVSAT